MDGFVEEKDHWRSSQEQYEDAEWNEAINWDDIVVEEAGPWANGAKPNEDGNIE